MHLVECGLDVVQRDGLADEAVQVETSLLVHVDEHRKVARRQAVAVPTRLQCAAATEEVEQWHLDPHLRCRYADQYDGAREVARIKGLLPRLRTADRVDRDVDAEAVGQLADRL